MHHVVRCAFGEFFRAMPAPCHRNRDSTRLPSLDHVALGVTHIKGRQVLIPGQGFLDFFHLASFLIRTNDIVKTGDAFLF